MIGESFVRTASLHELPGRHHEMPPLSLP